MRTCFPPCQGTAARQILTHTNGFWLLLGNPSILTWVDVLSQTQTLARSHQLFMWHRWRVAIRSQAVGLGDLRCCSVAQGNFEKQYPKKRKRKKKSPHCKCKFEVSLSVSVPWIKISLFPKASSMGLAGCTFQRTYIRMEWLFLQCLPNRKTLAVNNAWPVCMYFFLSTYGFCVYV